MEHSEWMEKAAQYIVEADESGVTALAEKYLEARHDPAAMIENGLSAGMSRLGDLFDRGEVFLPHLIIASEAMTAAVQILERALPEEKAARKVARVVLGTVEGDVHDIGKGIVATMLRVSGFEVRDLGRDVPISKFVEAAREMDADVVGSSALMTTTMVGQRALEKALREAGIRDRVKTIVGGAATTEHWARKIGADFHGETATETVQMLKEAFK